MTVVETVTSRGGPPPPWPTLAPMFHLYLVTDAEGSWPLVRDEPLAEPLAEPLLPTGTAVVALLGRFDRLDTARGALALAREAVCGEDRRDDSPLAAASRWPKAPEPQLPPPRRGHRRSGRRWIPG